MVKRIGYSKLSKSEQWQVNGVFYSINSRLCDLTVGDETPINKSKIINEIFKNSPECYTYRRNMEALYETKKYDSIILPHFDNLVRITNNLNLHIVLRPLHKMDNDEFNYFMDTCRSINRTQRELGDRDILLSNGKPIRVSTEWCSLIKQISALVRNKFPSVENFTEALNGVEECSAFNIYNGRLVRYSFVTIIKAIQAIECKFILLYKGNKVPFNKNIFSKRVKEFIPRKCTTRNRPSLSGGSQEKPKQKVEVAIPVDKPIKQDDISATTNVENKGDKIVITIEISVNNK